MSPGFGYLFVQALIHAALTVALVHGALYVWKEVMKR